MFFAVTGALHDAAITSWAIKRVYDSVRPITAIHYLYSDRAVRAACLAQPSVCDQVFRLSMLCAPA